MFSFAIYLSWPPKCAVVTITKMQHCPLTNPTPVATLDWSPSPSSPQMFWWCPLSAFPSPLLFLPCFFSSSHRRGGRGKGFLSGIAFSLPPLSLSISLSLFLFHSRCCCLPHQFCLSRRSIVLNASRRSVWKKQETGPIGERLARMRGDRERPNRTSITAKSQNRFDHERANELAKVRCCWNWNSKTVQH